MPYDNKPQAKSDGPSVLQCARADSLDCDYCRGEDTVTVYAPGYRGNPIAVTSAGLRYTARVQAHCQCNLGRHIRSTWPEEVQRRTPAVRDIVDGRSHWLLDDPTEGQ